jgi:hypothetical protein
MYNRGGIGSCFFFETEPNRVKIFNKLTNVLVPILDKVTKSRDSARS